MMCYIVENLASPKTSVDGQGWPSVPVAKTRTRMFEVSAPPWMARCRDGEKGPPVVAVVQLCFQKVIISD